MKLSHIVFTLFFLFTSFSVAQESSTEPMMEESAIKGFEFSIGGGIAYPYIPQEFKNQSKQGIDIHGGLGAMLKTGDVGYSALYLTLGYNSFDANNDEILKSYNKNATDWIPGGGSVKIFNVHLNYKGTFSTERTIAPYFLLGVGWNSFKQNEITLWDIVADTVMPVPENSRTDFSWNLGIGVDVPLGDVLAIYVEGKYILAVSNPLTQHFTTTGGIRYRL
ncbi:MAG: outer membrane beta-barrel protein [Ignavibacteriae bacterium]|nr:outer membrane beta-barrel protein [Ignavibacteriota bacterium]